MNKIIAASLIALAAAATSASASDSLRSYEGVNAGYQSSTDTQLYSTHHVTKKLQSASKSQTGNEDTSYADQIQSYD